MNRRRALALSAALLVGFGIGYTPVAAFAGTATSAVASYSVGGKSYTNKATISTSSNFASASTNVNTGSCVAAGWMGARGRLFAPSSTGGTLIQESSTAYNSSCSTGLGVPTNRNAHGTWFSYGVTYGWNGNGYNAYYTYKSPNQTS